MAKKNAGKGGSKGKAAKEAEQPVDGETAEAAAVPMRDNSPKKYHVRLTGPGDDRKEMRLPDGSEPFIFKRRGAGRDLVLTPGQARDLARKGFDVALVHDEAAETTQDGQ